MSGNQEERNRFLGFPVGQDPHRQHGMEQQRVMGFPADWLDRPSLDGVRFLVHPVRDYRRWRRHRRLGAYAAEEKAGPGPAE